MHTTLASMMLMGRFPISLAQTGIQSTGKQESGHQLDTERHQATNVVFTLRLKLGSQQAKTTQLSDNVKFFQHNDVAVEEKSNQFKSRKVSSKHKQSAATTTKVEEDSEDENDEEGQQGKCSSKDSPKPGTMLHANALALSETFYKMDLAEIGDNELLKIATDSKEVSWAFQLFLLNCELPLACKIAGRLTPFAYLLVNNIYGNYAIQKLVIRLPTFRQLVISFCRAYFWEMVFNQYSSRVLQLLSEINKPFAHFTLEALLEWPAIIGTRIETVFLAGAALRSMKGTIAVSTFGFGYLNNYMSCQQVSKGKFSKRLLLSLAQNAEEDLLDGLQAVLLNDSNSIKQHLGDRTLMQFLSTMVLKLHRPTLEVLFTAIHNDKAAIDRTVHAASFFKKVNTRLTSTAAKDVEAHVCKCSMLQKLHTELTSERKQTRRAVAAIKN
jgi:hypothetical protein